MTVSPALFRARLGAALRALPTDLVADSPRSRPTAAEDEVLEAARQLESATPGLALMMQLRARLFAEIVATARDQGFAQVVMVSCGFEHPRATPAHTDRVRLLRVEHPTVLDAFGGRTGRRERYVPAEDFQEATWHALGAHGASPQDHKTLLILQGLSLWGGVEALDFWLDRLAEQAALGGEMVLNLLDTTSAAHAQRAGDALVSPIVSPEVGIRFGIDGARLLERLAARGLHLRRLFDSHDLQRKHFGVEDLLVCEGYAWIAASEGTSDAPASSRTVRAASARALPLPMHRPTRPRLHPDVRVEAGTPPRVVLPVTDLRHVAVDLAPTEVASVGRFDGARTIAEIAALTVDPPDPDGTATSRLAHRLRTHGFLAPDPRAAAVQSAGLDARMHDATEAATVAFREAARRDPAYLGALRELAFDALERADRKLAGWVARRLAPLTGNAAACHLHALLTAQYAATRVARDGPLTVLMSSGGSQAEIRELATHARAALDACARALDVVFHGAVVVDVRSHRIGIPATTVSEVEPYTLVRVSRPQCSLALVTHELIHVLAMCGSPWLSEGLAVWLQREIAPGPCFPDDGNDIDANPSLPLAERLRPSMHSPAAHAARLDRAAYREAAGFVEWLVSRFGLPMFRRCFIACRHGSDEAELLGVCREAGFHTIRHLEDEWWRTRP